MNTLCWTPTSTVLFNAVRTNGLAIAISPFVKSNALEQLIAHCDKPEQLQVVCAWTAQSLMSGATDVEIYPLLRSAGARLFVHPRIHLKLYVLSNNRAFHSSGNLTLRGLGLCDEPNIEIGTEVSLELKDWRAIYQILEESIPVDDRIYSQAKEFTARNQPITPIDSELILSSSLDRRFSINSLPLCENPEEFLTFCREISGGMEQLDRSSLHAFAHDQTILRIEQDLFASVTAEQIASAFRRLSLVKEFVRFLQYEGTARFGSVTAWLQENCSDRPQPYRKDLKATVRTLYNWLSATFEEISWDVPGRRSMVIRWRQ